MQIHKDHYWKNLNLNDYRARFFIETCYEILHTKSPSFHQVRLNNVISSSKEVLDSINDYNTDKKNLRNLYNSINELKFCLEKDNFIKPLISIFHDNLNSLLSSIGTDESKEIDKFKIRELLLYLKNIIFLENEYQNILTEKLIYLVTSDKVNLKQITRNLNDINKISNLYITHLLSKDYSLSYLYHRMQMFTRKNNYSKRNFKEQLYFVLNNLNNRKTSFEVYFIIHKYIDIEFIKSLFDKDLLINISNILINDILKEEVKNFNSRNTYISITITSTDYISAAFQSKRIIDLLLDKLDFHNLLCSNDIDETCYVIETIKDKNTLKKVHINKLLSFVNKINIDIYKEHNLFLEIENKLDSKSIDRFKRSIHYLRMSKNTDSLEQKLLNMWIALESLFDKHENTIIGDIIKWIPLIYSTSSLIIKVEYILNLLVEYEIKIPTEIKKTLNIKYNSFKYIDIELFSKILFDEHLCKFIFNNCNNKEFLKFRLRQTFEEFKNPKKTLASIEKSCLNVERHIKRIYVIRNKLTHQAFHGNVKGQIVNHLNEYLFICYTSIYTTITNLNEERKISIDDSFLAYKLGSQNLYNKLKLFNEDNFIMKYEYLKIKPLI